MKCGGVFTTVLPIALEWPGMTGTLVPVSSKAASAAVGHLRQITVGPVGPLA